MKILSKISSNQNVKGHAITGSLLLTALGVLCVLFIADDASAWGVPGRAAPGSGQGPGGGARSGSAPAPFGLLYLSFAMSLGAVIHGKIVTRMTTSASLAFLVGFAGVLGHIHFLFAFLLSIPLIGLHLACRHKLRTFTKTEWLMACCALFVAPLVAQETALLLACSLVIYYLGRNKNTPWQLTLNGCLSVMVVLCLWTPVANQINPWLQVQMAELTSFGLSLLGYNVSVTDNFILGLGTTIHVTKACVGMEVFATSFVLCAFLSMLFIKPEKQPHASAQLFGLVFFLNLIRLVIISLLGHYLLNWSFVAMHDVLGWVIALITYGLIAIVLCTSPHKQTTTVNEGKHA